MSRAATRHGRVIDASGAPVADAIVSVVSGTAATPEIAVLTDTDGAFRLGLPDGRFQIRAVAPNGATGTTDHDGANPNLEIVVRPTLDPT